MLRQTLRHSKSSHILRTTLKILIIVFLFLSSATTASPWQKLAPGIEYRDIGANVLAPWSHIHAFRIDLKNNQLDLITAKALNKTQASIDQFAHHTQAMIAIRASPSHTALRGAVRDVAPWSCSEILPGSESRSAGVRSRFRRCVR